MLTMENLMVLYKYRGDFNAFCDRVAKEYTSETVEPLILKNFSLKLLEKNSEPSNRSEVYRMWQDFLWRLPPASRKKLIATYISKERDQFFDFISTVQSGGALTELQLFWVDQLSQTFFRHTPVIDEPLVTSVLSPISNTQMEAFIDFLSNSHPVTEKGRFKLLVQLIKQGAQVQASREKKSQYVQTVLHHIFSSIKNKALANSGSNDSGSGASTTSAEQTMVAVVNALYSHLNSGKTEREMLDAEIAHYFKPVIQATPVVWGKRMVRAVSNRTTSYSGKRVDRDDFVKQVNTQVEQDKTAGQNSEFDNLNTVLMDTSPFDKRANLRAQFVKAKKLSAVKNPNDINSYIDALREYSKYTRNYELVNQVHQFSVSHVGQSLSIGT
jgi:hypothetical protein